MVHVSKHKSPSFSRCLAALLAGAIAGCDFPGRPNPEDRPVPFNQVTDFGRLFRTNCAGCHGADGKLGPAPPLNDELFLNIVSDADLLRVISEGRPGTPMPAFAREHGGSLNESQVKALASGLKVQWKTQLSSELPWPSYVSAGNNSDDQTMESLKRGEVAFARACAVCHGDQGQGTAEAGAIHDEAFLALISDQALRRIIITGRPDLGMPSFADDKARGSHYQPLSTIEIDELVALLGSWRHGVPRAARVAQSQATRRLPNDAEGPKP